VYNSYLEILISLLDIFCCYVICGEIRIKKMEREAVADDDPIFGANISGNLPWDWISEGR